MTEGQKDHVGHSKWGHAAAVGVRPAVASVCSVIFSRSKTAGFRYPAVFDHSRMS